MESCTARVATTHFAAFGSIRTVATMLPIAAVEDPKVERILAFSAPDWPPLEWPPLLMLFSEATRTLMIPIVSSLVTASNRRCEGEAAAHHESTGGEPHMA
jgi:hypothetical protein